jgi:hypothetical protein
MMIFSQLDFDSHKLKNTTPIKPETMIFGQGMGNFVLTCIGGANSNSKLVMNNSGMESTSLDSIIKPHVTNYVEHRAYVTIFRCYFIQ